MIAHSIQICHDTTIWQAWALALGPESFFIGIWVGVGICNVIALVKHK